MSGLADVRASIGVRVDDPRAAPDAGGSLALGVFIGAPVSLTLWWLIVQLIAGVAS